MAICHKLLRNWKTYCFSLLSGMVISTVFCGVMYQYDIVKERPGVYRNVANTNVPLYRPPEIISVQDKLLHIQKTRLKTMEDYCANRKREYNISVDFASIVDDEHKIVLVAIPKTGCTMWKTAIYENRNKIQQSHTKRRSKGGRVKRSTDNHNLKKEKPNQDAMESIIQQGNKLTQRTVNGRKVVQVAAPNTTDIGTLKSFSGQSASSNQTSRKSSQQNTSNHTKKAQVHRQRTGANIHNFGFITSSGLRWIHDLKDEEKQRVFESYFNILTIRHPLDRLESSYQDKVVHYKQNSEKIRENLVKYLAKEDGVIISKYSDKTVPMKYQQNTTFENFLAFILEASNRHWNNFMDNAHPCSVPYSFISKTETLDMDLEYIIAENLSGKGQVKTLNSFRQNTNATSIGRLLPLFSQLPDPESWIQRLMVQYQDDMDMFGYSYTIRDGKVYATCTTYMYDGICV